MSISCAVFLAALRSNDHDLPMEGVAKRWTQGNVAGVVVLFL